MSQLRHGQAIILTPEPGEPFPGSIGMRTLAGDCLGCARSGREWQVQHGVPIPGRIDDQVGGPPARGTCKGLWGARFSCYPTAVSLLPVPVPASFEGSEAAQRLASHQEPGSRPHLRAIDNAVGKCEVSGMPCDELVTAPLWVLDIPAKTVSLKRLAAVHPLVAEAVMCFQRPELPHSPPLMVSTWKA